VSDTKATSEVPVEETVLLPVGFCDDSGLINWIWTLLGTITFGVIFGILVLIAAVLYSMYWLLKIGFGWLGPRKNLEELHDVSQASGRTDRRE
jgi:hypothetical protein